MMSTIYRSEHLQGSVLDACRVSTTVTLSGSPVLRGRSSTKLTALPKAIWLGNDRAGIHSESCQIPKPVLFPNTVLTAKGKRKLCYLQNGKL